MKLKIMMPSSATHVVTLDDTAEATADHLMAHILSLDGLGEASFSVRGGFPPRRIPLEGSVSLKQLGIRNGDKLTVVHDDNPDSGAGSRSRGSLGSDASVIDRVKRSPTPTPTPPPIKKTNTTKTIAKPEQSSRGVSKVSKPSPSAVSAASAASFSTLSSIKPKETTANTNTNTNTTPGIEADTMVKLSPNQTLTLRIMADDNSCLFHAIGHVIFQNSELGGDLRTIVAQTIGANPTEYTDAILGKPRTQYMTWIQQSTSWGGAIELTILAAHFGLTIASLDVATGRIDWFNPDMPTFCAVVYSGIHYDSVALVKGDPSNRTADLSQDQTVFETNTDLGDRVVAGLTQLSQQLKGRHYYTDTARFAIECLDCHTVFYGQTAAAKHAKVTNHGRFGEVAQ